MPTARDPLRRVKTFAMATCQSGRSPRGLGNTKSHVRNFERVSTTFSAGLDNGTPCSRPALVRTAGIVHTHSPKSISDQRAPSVSPVRSRRQYAGLKRASGDRWICPQIFHESRQIPVGHRRMVAAPEFSSFWKEVREVAAPYGRISPGDVLGPWLHREPPRCGREVVPPFLAFRSRAASRLRGLPPCRSHQPAGTLGPPHPS